MTPREKADVAEPRRVGHTRALLPLSSRGGKAYWLLRLASCTGRALQQLKGLAPGMSEEKAIEAVQETIPPVSGPRRRQTQPMFNASSSVARPIRTPTQPGLSAPPPPPPSPSVGERVLRAVGLTRRPVRAPR